MQYITECSVYRFQVGRVETAPHGLNSRTLIDADGHRVGFEEIGWPASGHKLGSQALAVEQVPSSTMLGADSSSEQLAFQLVLLGIPVSYLASGFEMVTRRAEDL